MVEKQRLGEGADARPTGRQISARAFARRGNSGHEWKMPMISPRRWLWIALLASTALLVVAYGLERFGGAEPCQPCLLQQRVHWAVVGVCVVGLVDRKSAWSGRVLLAVLGALF